MSGDTPQELGSTERLPREDGPAHGVPCDYCGVEALAWRKCKLICGNCRNINKSCADL